MTELTIGVMPKEDCTLTTEEMQLVGLEFVAIANQIAVLESGKVALQDRPDTPRPISIMRNLCYTSMSDTVNKLNGYLEIMQEVHKLELIVL